MTFYAAVSILYFFYDISGFNLNFMIFYDFANVTPIFKKDDATLCKNL